MDERNADAVAAALAGASREQADAFLAEQTQLARRQRVRTELEIESLRDQDRFELSHLRWRRFNDQLSGALRVIAVIFGVSLLLGLCILLWRAHEADGLVVESFSVPPDLAGNGLTGNAAALHFLDRLSDLQTETATARPASSYANAWDNDIKLEIPDTGVSIGELSRYLREWLGHETHISGEIVRTANGLAVTIRATGASAHTVQGPGTDPDALIRRAAETIYAETQPYRWAIYLQSHGKIGEALAAYAALAKTGAPEELPWAYDGWSSALNQQGELKAAAAKAYEGLGLLGPGERIYEALAGNEAPLEHTQAEMAAARGVLRFASGEQKPFTEAVLAQLQGDYGRAADIYARLRAFVVIEGQPAAYDAQLMRMRAEALDHNIGLARRLDRPAATPRMMEYEFVGRVAGDAGLGDWAATARDIEAFQSRLDPSVPRQAVTLQRTVWPRLAFADAELGHAREAAALIAKTPLDCDVCVRVRGHVAALNRDWAQAARWFALVAARSPDIPFADADWGAMLLAKGDLDGAIAKFASASRKGPHFADPLEMWGEALIAKNRSDLALAKFEEADKYAPNWGRLHLKWGEALWWSGNHDGARRQFAIAAGLDLAGGERDELARMGTGHG